MAGEIEVDHAYERQLRSRHRDAPVARRPDAALAELAGKQHGVVARRQLLERRLLTSAEIDRRRWAGRLIAIHRGVYAVGHSHLSRHGRWMAAVLAGGPGAVLSHESAAMLWELTSPTTAEPRITAPTRGLKRPGIACRSGRLADDEVTSRHGIPVTTVPRTILDLAAAGSRQRTERALAEAEYRRYADRLSLPDLLARHRGRRGTATLRGVLASGNALLGVTRSALEDRFLALCDRHGLPRPELNAAIDLGGRHALADCLWRAARLVVELDGFAAHGGSRRRFEADAARRRAMAVAGWRVVAVTWRQLGEDPAAVAAELRLLLGSAPPGPGSPVGDAIASPA